MLQKISNQKYEYLIRQKKQLEAVPKVEKYYTSRIKATNLFEYVGKRFKVFMNFMVKSIHPRKIFHLK